ncbi:hypothetical protein [Verrucomicrobium spinosum]|uniref:hypothetical protein n=1 Tax=Verrucomicrobium spinosum TaxID=2736 RepID=UPI000946726C|nr:hypothetical protein [Verrucomicrobium spinosum]
MLEAIGELNMQPNVEAMIYALPMVADANEGQQAGLQFLKQELQKTLGWWRKPSSTRGARVAEAGRTRWMSRGRYHRN